MKRRLENMILTHSDRLDDRIVGLLQQYAPLGRAWLSAQLAADLKVDVADVHRVLGPLVATGRIGLEERDGAPARYFWRNPGVGRPMSSRG